MDLKDLLGNIPGSYVSIGLLFILGILFFVFIYFNRQILKLIGNIRLGINKFVSKHFGSTFRSADKKFRRTAFLRTESLWYKIYRVFDNMITNLNLQKNGVTVFGLILFMCVLAFIITLIISILFNFGIFLGFFMFITAFVAVFVVFMFNSLSHKEKFENEIMDAVDLLVSDVKGGIHNAITRYMESIHPDIKPYFLEFIDNTKTKGLSFKSAMLILNDRLGPTFSDFAHKAIMYEEKADAEFDDIFSAILEVNRHKRILRAKNNFAFQQLMLTFIISFAMVAGFAVYITLTEPFVSDFLINNIVGKFLLILDFIVFIVVLGVLTYLKAKSFE